MKKTYECKPLLLTVVCFHAYMLVGGFGARVAANKLMSFNLGGAWELIFDMMLICAASIGAIVVSIQLYLYYTKKEKSVGMLYNAIANAIFGVVLFLMLWKNSFSDFSGGLMLIWQILSLAILAINVVAMLRLDKKINFDKLDAYLPSNHFSQTRENQQEGSPISLAKGSGEAVVQDVDQQAKASAPVINGQTTKAFFKSKTGKIISLIVIMVIVVFGGYKVWDTYFNLTVIDVFKNAEVEYFGASGEGYVSISPGNIEYDKTDKNIKYFLYDVDFETEEDGALKNGDKITVTAVYDKEEAKRLKIKLKDETKEFEVSGLIESYKSAADIDKSLYAAAEKVAKEKAATTFTEKDESLVNAYYVIDTEDSFGVQSNYLAFVYKGTYKSFSGKAETRYYCFYTDFDSSYDPDYEYMGSSRMYKADSYDYISEDKDVLDSLKDSYMFESNSKFEQIK